ncbi:adenosine deaminase, partial [Francisella tularensis subsp. holarctica]|nr:adenosine deaminase [Francisella tularensis subsp. holarctica]
TIHLASTVSSNVALAIVDSFETHSYQQRLADNFSIALNTDDRLMLRIITMTDEYYNAYLKNNLSCVIGLL